MSKKPSGKVTVKKFDDKIERGELVHARKKWQILSKLVSYFWKGRGAVQEIRKQREKK